MKKIVMLGGALAVLIANAGVASAQQYPDRPSYSQPDTNPQNGDQGPPPNGYQQQNGYPNQNGNPNQNGYPNQNGDPNQNGYQQGPPPGNPHDDMNPDRFFEALHQVDLNWQQRRQVRDIVRNSNGDRRETMHQVLAVLDDGQRHQLFDIMRTEDRRTYGVVGDFNQFDMHLENGQYVHLHQGTVINPTGFDLHHGLRVAIRGHFDRNGTLEADQIDVQGRDFMRQY